MYVSTTYLNLCTCKVLIAVPISVLYRAPTQDHCFLRLLYIPKTRDFNANDGCLAKKLEFEYPVRYRFYHWLLIVLFSNIKIDMNPV